MNGTSNGTSAPIIPVTTIPSPNPWAEGGDDTLPEPSPAAAPIVSVVVPQDLEIEASTKVFDTILTPSPSKPLANAALINEFDPLVDRTELEAQQAWSASEGHPPQLPPPVPEKATPKGKSDRPTVPPPLKAKRPLSTSLDPPTSAAATVTSFSTLANLARTLSRSRDRPSTPTATSPKVQPKPTAAGEPPAAQLPPNSARDDHAVPQATSIPNGEQAAAKPEPPAFDFQKFLDQMKTRSAEPVAKYLRSFLNSFSKRNFTVNDQIKLIHDFLAFIALRMRDCEVWKHNTEEEFDNAMEGMEKLVMNRLYDFTFTPQIDSTNHPITTDDLEKDHILRQRMKLFGWITEVHLDVPVGEGSTGFIDFARQELLKMNHYKAPRDKLICILNCCKVIFGLIRHLNQSEGADSFIPILIYVVLKSNPEHLISNIEYINRFRSASKLQSEAGYYLSSLMGAVSFIETMDHASLSNITQEEFEQNVEEAIQELPPSPPHLPGQLPKQPAFFQNHGRPSTPTSGPHTGEESARPLQLPSTTSVAEDAKRFLLRTGDLATETISKPLNAIGRIFNDALDNLDDRERDKERAAALEREQRRDSGGFLPSASWLFDSPRSGTPVTGSRAAEFEHLRADDPRVAAGATFPRTPAGSGGTLNPAAAQTPYRPRIRRPSGTSTPGRGTPDLVSPAPIPFNQQQHQQHQQQRISPSSPFQIPPLNFFASSPSQHSAYLPSPARQYDTLPTSSSLPSASPIQDPRYFYHPQQSPHAHHPNQQMYHPYPQHPPGQPSGFNMRDGTPLDLTALSNEIDRAHSQAQAASRGTLLQIFPGCDPDVVDMVLEATNNDLGLSIDRLLEITSTP